MPALLEVQDLHAHFFSKDGVVKAVNGVNLTLQEGETVGLLGESGAGKTVTALSIMGLVPYPGRVVAGKVLLNGRNLLSLQESAMRGIRAREIAIAFQDPMATLNPRLSIGTQVQEVFLAHTPLSKREARRASIDLLEEVGLPDPERMMDLYPFQLSGGMAQRVMLALAMALRPPVILADELTSNLDVTLQADMLQRLQRLQRERGTAILLITHDLGVLARTADRIAVMYAGTIVEEGPTKDFFRRPLHPYSWGMLRALPRMDRDERLVPIPGIPPDMKNLEDQCPFLPRCFKATIMCRTGPRPLLTELHPEHWAACYNPLQVAGE